LTASLHNLTDLVVPFAEEPLGPLDNFGPGVVKDLCPKGILFLLPQQVPSTENNYYLTLMKQLHTIITLVSQ
jgi:hypothetical protein